jgi:hypothetical protein
MRPLPSIPKRKNAGIIDDVATKKPPSSLGFSFLLVWALLLLPLTASGGDSLILPTPTSHERVEYIRRSRVWEPTDVSSKDLYNGPEGKLNFTVDQEITCDFVPKPLAGFTEKFLCRLDDGRIFKVKYLDGNRYKEVFGEVLGTRLFWALGFYADRMLPVRVTCRGCPRHPWTYVDARKNKHHLDDQGLLGSLPPDADIGTHTFDPAAMEEKIDAEPIEERKDQGWSWKSLKLVDESLGGATKAEIDALKLLNAFVQNADNKFKQNALACLRSELVEDDTGHVTCRRPILYVDDLGSVFGKGGFITGNAGRVDYEGWKERPVWRDPESCKARLVSIGGILRASTLRDPVISEEGRALLAGQLEQLSDAQIADLFRAARIERLHQTTSDGLSGSREVTLEDWVELFRTKRDEITKHPGCPTQHGVEASGEVP